MIQASLNISSMMFHGLFSYPIKRTHLIMTVFLPISFNARVALTAHQSNSTELPILYTPLPRMMAVMN